MTKTDEFSSVFGFRKALKSTHFLLHYRLRAAEEVAGARLGLVVAKRLLRRSVDRNPVSYTHLDVYKRQARSSLPSIKSRRPLR